MDTELKEIGARMKGLRENEGLSEAEFGAMYKKNENTVKRWERGEYVPMGRIQDIAKYYGVEADYILYGSVEEKPVRKVDAPKVEPAKAPIEATAVEIQPLVINEGPVSFQPLRETFLCDRIITGITRLSSERRNQALGYLQALSYMNIT